MYTGWPLSSPENFLLPKTAGRSFQKEWFYKDGFLETAINETIHWIKYDSGRSFS